MSEIVKPAQAAGRGQGIIGSLRDALAAAGREDMHAKAQPLATVHAPVAVKSAGTPPPMPAATENALVPTSQVKPTPQAVQGAADTPHRDGRPHDGAADAGEQLPRAADAAREVRATVTMRPQDKALDRHVEPDLPPTTRVFRGKEARALAVEDAPRTQLVRGRQKLVRSDFTQDPVVGWLVVVGGPGLGAFRPIFEGNNTIGRASSQRIPVDFGDDAISSEEQAYIRYDSTDRSFLFVPNLAKTNVVRVNDKKPTSAVELAHMDVITMGRTQLVFVPFCGKDFDWAELADVKD